MAIDTISNQVSRHLGPAPIQLPEPVAEIARSVVANSKGQATIGSLTPSPWLLPGGQPGRPISTCQLTLRLNRLGIRPNQARSTALFQLTSEIPAAILARILGVHTDVAVSWQRLSAGDWTNYAAEISQRPPWSSGIRTVPISDVTIYLWPDADEFTRSAIGAEIVKRMDSLGTIAYPVRAAKGGGRPSRHRSEG